MVRAVTQWNQTGVPISRERRETGAVAEGYVSFIGTAIQQQWLVQAEALGTTRMVPGPATVVALARSTISAGHPDDAHQWLVNVTLVRP